MDKTFREKIALIVFAMLVVVASVVLIGYFSTGRSWTIAATFVDDTVGEMDGYSVILFNGVVEPDIDADDDSKTRALNSSSGAAASSTLDGQTPSSSEERSITDPDNGPVEEISQGQDLQAEALLETKDGLIQDDSVLRGDGVSSGSDIASQSPNALLDPAHSVGLRILAMYPRAINAEYDGVFVSDVSDLYERKGASVISLNLSDLEHYNDPMVLSSGSKKIGVFSIESYKGKQEMSAIEQDMADQGANVVVCITPRLALISDYDAIDVVILTTPIEQQSQFYRSKVGGDTFVVQAPERGDVGLVILSSNDIPSSRVIEVL